MHNFFVQKIEKAVIYREDLFLKNTTSTPNYQIFTECKIMKNFLKFS